MKFHPTELFFIYDPTSTYSRQTLAYAYTLTPHVQVHEIGKDPFTTTLWRQILNYLDLPAKSLFNRANRQYQKTIAGGQYNDEDWLNILTHNPHMIDYPIAVLGNRGVLCKSPTDILKLANTQVAAVATV